MASVGVLRTGSGRTENRDSFVVSTVMSASAEEASGSSWCGAEGWVRLRMPWAHAVRPYQDD